MKSLIAFLETLTVALVGVVVFSVINMPLPWLIGSLVAIALWHIATQRTLVWPITLRQMAMVVLGYLIGTSFTKDALVEMGDHIPSMIVITLITIAFSLALGWTFSKMTRLDLTSCMIASVPGGLSQIMVLLDEIKGLNPTIIMFMQSTRVMMIVIAVPILTVYLFGVDTETIRNQVDAGAVTWSDMPWHSYITYPVMMVAAAWLSNRLHVPTALLLGPMILTFILTFSGAPTPDLPDGFVNVAQLFIGVHIGRQMQPRDLPNWKRMALYTLIAVAMLVVFGIGIGLALTWFYDISFTTALLATAPGGMVEMGITAIAIGGDVSVVTSYQLFRLLTIILFVPFFFRWFKKRREQHI